jgi:hypothetical protein
VGNIGPDALFRKPVGTLPKVLQVLGEVMIFALADIYGFQLTVLYICVSKNEAADSDDHRQIREEVYTLASVSSLRNSPRRF